MSSHDTPDEESDERAPHDERRDELAALVLRRTALTEREIRLFRSAFPAIVRAYHDRVWRELRRRGAPAPALEDLLQDVFFTFFNQVVEQGFPDSIPEKLQSLAAGKASNERRGEQRDPVSLGLPSSRSETPKSAPEAERVIDLLKLAPRLLLALSDEHREVVDAVLLRELSHEEAAVELGLARSTVTSRLLAARQKLLEMAKLFLPESQRGPS